MKTKSTILVLHGWGGTASQSFQELKVLLEKEGFTVEVPDLPGFEKRSEIKKPFTFDDYVDFVEKIVKNRQVTLLGHSFGGRLAIAFTAQNPTSVSKLILSGASGVPYPLSVKKQFGLFLAKAGKIIFAIPGLSYFGPMLQKLNYVWLGEWDYYRTGGSHLLKETFKNVYRVDIRHFLPKIACPTLLVWGENDVIIPVSDGEYMQKHIKNARLIIVKGATHKLPYEMPHVFVENIVPFLS